GAASAASSASDGRPQTSAPAASELVASHSRRVKPRASVRVAVFFVSFIGEDGGRSGSGVFQNNFHALAIVGAEHADGFVQFAELHDVAHQGLEADDAALYQGDGIGVILRLGDTRVDEREFLEVQIIKRESAFFRGDDAEKEQAPADTGHGD